MTRPALLRYAIFGCVLFPLALVVGCGGAGTQQPSDSMSSNRRPSDIEYGGEVADDAGGGGNVESDRADEESFSVGAGAGPDDDLSRDVAPIESGASITPRMGIRAQGADAGGSAERSPVTTTEGEPATAFPDEDAFLEDDEHASSGPADREAEMARDGFATLEVFYATDRLAREATLIAGRDYIERFYPMALCAALTALAIALTPLLRKRPLSPLLTWLGAGSTIALGMAAGWSCIGLWQAARQGGATYGPERGELTLGTCRVSIPASHDPGEMERPSILRLEVREDARKHIVLQSARPLPDDEFYAALQDRVEQSPRLDAFVFVHGFDNTFDEAARRTAQIAADLKFEGAPICYSWPSQGNLLKYTVDENNVEWTVPHLRQFLTDLAQRSGADSIHLIAHSMGNRALTNALRLLSRDLQGSPLFHEVVLTAPDIDADVFKRDIAPAILGTAQRVTLYASATDEALLLSKKVHGFPRAGDTGRNLIILPGMDTIDVTGIDTSLLGHAYYAANESVLTDLVQLLTQNLPANRRELLLPSDRDGQRYWTFQADTRTARPAGGESR